MSNEELDWKNFHHGIYQIYHGFIAITLVPFALLFLGWDSGGAKVDLDYGTPLFILTAQLLWVVGYLSWYVWKGEKVQYSSSLEDLNISEKLKEFKKRNVAKYVLLAVGGIISVFAMWVQPSFIFVIGYFAILIQYSFLRPSEDKIVRDMRLSKEDRSLLHEEQ